MLSYGCVNLITPTAALAAAVEGALAPSDFFDFERLDWPGDTRRGWTFPGQAKHRPVKVGTLYWPRDASRFAVGYFLASENQLASIRAASAGDGYLARPLVLSYEDQTRETVYFVDPDMWMLPPRPLFQIEDANGLYLLTFVDDRYFWWFRDTGYLPVTDETTWQDLYDGAAEALGIDVENDEVAAAYLTPSVKLASLFEQTPLLLDALAYNVGQRIVRDWDTGDTFAYGPSSSVAILAENLDEDYTVVGGGAFAFEPEEDNDLPAILPAYVQIVFAMTASAATTTCPGAYPLTVALADLELDDLGDTGNEDAVKTFHDTLVAGALTEVEGYEALVPGNITTLTALAEQVATDWYRQQAAPVDVKFNGIVPWAVEGLSDAIEWTYRVEEVSTRIYRPVWNDLTEELLHADEEVAAPSYFITPTSEDTETVTLSEGSLEAYPAARAYLDSTTGAMVSDTGNPVWLYLAGGGKVQTGIYYAAELMGADEDCTPIWVNPGFVCLGPIVTNVACSDGSLLQTIQYLNLPAGSYLSDYADCGPTS